MNVPSEAALPEKILIYSVSERKCTSRAFKGGCLLVQKGGHSHAVMGNVRTTFSSTCRGYCTL